MTARLSPADRQGRFVLLVIYITLLGGGFALDRVSPSLPSLPLRWVGLPVCVLLTFGWFTVHRETMRRAAGIQWPFWWFLLWSAYLALSAVWAPYPANVGLRLADVALTAIFTALAYAVASRVSTRALSSVFTWFLVTGALYLGDALSRGPATTLRFSAFQGGPNIFGRVMALAAVGALYHAVRYRRTWAVFAAIAFGVGVLLSGSRGGMVALAGAFVLLALPLVPRLKIRALALLAVAFAVLMVHYRARFLTAVHWNDIYQRIVVETFQQHYDSSRSTIFSSAIEVGLHHPLIGAGLDGYFAVYGSLHNVIYAHNIFLETFADGGVIGLLLLVGVLVGWSVLLVRSRPVSVETRLAVMAAAVVLIGALFSGSFYDARFLWFALVYAGVFARRTRPTPDTPVTMPARAVGLRVRRTAASAPAGASAGSGGTPTRSPARTT